MLEFEINGLLVVICLFVAHVLNATNKEEKKMLQFIKADGFLCAAGMLQSHFGSAELDYVNFPLACSATLQREITVRGAEMDKRFAQLPGVTNLLRVCICCICIAHVLL